MAKGSFLIFNMIVRKVLEEKITCSCCECGENIRFCVPQHIYEWENKSYAKAIKKNLKKGIYGVELKKDVIVKIFSWVKQNYLFVINVKKQQHIRN